MDDLLTTLAIGAYVFAAGGYVYTWLVYTRLHTLLSNHLRHELDDILARLRKLEGGD